MGEKRGLELLRAAIEEQKCEMPCSALHELHGDRRNICNDRDCIECRLDALRKAADLVEEELDALKARSLPEGMEWPTVDGKPVVIGERMRSCGIDDCKVVGIDPGNSRLILASDNIEEGKATYFTDFAEYCHRPAPKVLDADGAEIRVGDTVCGTRDMEPMRVVDTDSRECGFKHIKCEKEGDGFWFYCPDELTHKLPVIAADGKPLREGETVWGTGREEHEYVILGQPGLGGGAGRFKVSCHDVTDDVDCDCDPDLLTHERPVADTWERLEEDAGKEACEYFAHMPCGCETSEMLDETVEKCNAAKARDIVRRAKALAGVSE